MQGTGEEQFAAIAAAARAEALNDIDDILTDDESVDYSPSNTQPLEPQVQVQTNNQQSSDSDETNNCIPESTMLHVHYIITQLVPIKLDHNQ